MARKGSPLGETSSPLPSPQATIGHSLATELPVMPSNSRIFARRGDPWVSQKEGRRDFGRFLESENPDYDCDVFAEHPKQRHERGSDKPIEPEMSEGMKSRRRLAAAANRQNVSNAKTAKSSWALIRLAQLDAVKT